jgi:hypothetical protein
MSRFLVALTLVLVLGATTGAMAQEMLPNSAAVVSPQVAYYAPAPVPAVTYYPPAALVAYYAPAPTVTYYAPPPAYVYPAPAWVARPVVAPLPYPYYGGYTVRTRYFPFSTRTVVRAW